MAAAALSDVVFSIQRVSHSHTHTHTLLLGKPLRSDNGSQRGKS